MSINRQKTNRNGFTLLELVASLIGLSILLVSLGSAMVIALKASDSTSTPAPATLAGLDALNDLQADLQYALTITEALPASTTFTIPDRNGDASAETIRYAWSGTPGSTLIRRYNWGTSYILASNVHNFNIQYHTSGSKKEYLTVTLQLSADASTAVQTAIPLLNRP